MVWGKLGLIVDQCYWKSEFHSNFQWKSPVSKFKGIYPTVYTAILRREKGDRYDFHIRSSLVFRKDQMNNLTSYIYV
jgi:hypothetical protein